MKKLIGRTDVEDALKKRYRGWCLFHCTSRITRLAVWQSHSPHCQPSDPQSVMDNTQTMIPLTQTPTLHSRKMLKRLDKLIQEEARMATTEVLKVTHTVDDRVRGVLDKVVGVDDRVACVDEGVRGVSDQVLGVNDRVVGVDERVRVVADKASEVIDGTQYIFGQFSKETSDHRATRRKRSEGSHATNSRACRPNQTFVVS